MSLRGRPRACSSWGSQSELSGQPLALDGYRSGLLDSELPGQKLALHDGATGHPRAARQRGKASLMGLRGRPRACSSWGSQSELSGDSLFLHDDATVDGGLAMDSAGSWLCIQAGAHLVR